MQNARSLKAKCSTGVKVFVFKNSDSQDSEVRWKTVDRITKWTEIADLQSHSFKQTMDKVYGDKMQLVSLSTGVSIYIKLKFRHLVALSPSKRIYAILCKWNLVSGIISVWQSLPFEKKVSAQKNCTRLLMLCYLHLKKYTLTSVSMFWTLKLRIHHSHVEASRSSLAKCSPRNLSSCSPSAFPF